MKSRIVLFVFLLVSWACEDAGSPVNFGESSAPILPLKTGNTWSYRISLYDTLGSLIELYFDTVVVQSPTIVSGEEWYLWRDPDEYLADQTSGTWYRNIRSDTMSAPGLFYKYPVSVGESWISPHMMYSTISVKAISTDAVIDVPAGRFACYVYQLGASQIFDYLVPGIGLVFSRAYELVPSGNRFTFIRELVSYRLR